MSRRFRVIALLGLFMGSSSFAETIANWPVATYWRPPGKDSTPGDGSRRDTYRTSGSEEVQGLPTAPLPLTAITPCRIVDTRGNGAPIQGGPFAGSESRNYTLTGPCGIPSEAQAVSLNVTVTQALGPDHITIYPQGEPAPTVSTLNYVAGETIANAAIAALGPGGGLTVTAAVSGTDLIIDTNGYFAPQAVVNTLNGLSGAVSLNAGTGISITPSGQTLTVDAKAAGTAWSLTGNSGTVPGVNFLGTTDGQPLELRVGERALRIENYASSPNLIGGFAGNLVVPGVFGGAIAGGGDSASGPNRISDNYGAIGGGRANQVGNGNGNVSDAMDGTVGGGEFNSASGLAATVAGGIGNTARETGTVIGGGSNNVATASHATVAGGFTNRASGFVAVVAGGSANVASELSSTVGGGTSNSATGFYGTVAGGNANASIDRGTVSGGEFNIASGYAAAVGGGSHNTASGGLSVIPGGQNNVALGGSSFAAGTSAKANHTGAFVWGDYDFSDLASTAPNQFVVRASGGIWLGTTSSPVIGASDFLSTSTGAHLTSSGVWKNNSDRDAKENFETIDQLRVLEQVANLPISRWNYKVDGGDTRHVGPTAQDFAATFGLGGDDRSISTLDAEGVALAAIQALYALIREKDCEIDELRQRLSRIEDRTR